jgi:hypothetical protein
MAETEGRSPPLARQATAVAVRDLRRDQDGRQRDSDVAGEYRRRTSAGASSPSGVFPRIPQRQGGVDRL